VIDAARAEDRLVTRVFHPSPDGELLHLRDGMHAVVEVGPAGYQVTTGETIAL
jgi:hypothetical protein